MSQLDLMSKTPDGVIELEPDNYPDGIRRDLIDELLAVYRYRSVPFRKVRTDSGSVRVHVPTYDNAKEHYQSKYLFGGSCVSIGRGNVVEEAKIYIDKDYPKGWESKL